MTYVKKSFAPAPSPEGTDAARPGANEAILAGWRWVPKRTLRNPAALVRAARLTGTNRDGEYDVEMIIETEHHLRLPKQLVCQLPVLEYRDLSREIVRDTVAFADLMVPRDRSQEAAWSALQQAQSGVLNLACGKGKTSLALKKIASAQEPALVIVHTEFLMGQWRAAAKQFLGLSDDEIGTVQGPVAEWDRPLVLAMLPTLAARVDSYGDDIRQRFRTIVVDELHHLAASSWSVVAGAFIGDWFGLTATIERTDGLEGLFLAHIGPVIYRDLETDVPADVFFRKTDFALPLGEEDTLFSFRGEFLPAKLYSALAASVRRNRTIVEDLLQAVDRGRKILVLSHSMAHCEELARALQAKRPGLAVAVVHGKSKGDRIASISEATVSVATFQLAREALDVPALDSLVLTTPFKNYGAFQQAKGRIERTHAGKQKPMVVVYDDVKVGPAHGLCQALRRELRLNRITFREL